MLGRLNTRLDSFDDQMPGIEGEIGRIRRHWNILIFDAELEEEMGDDEEEDQPGDE